jgi:energy-coupling factor transporter ATP-binding protein EcfA2
MTAQPTAEPAIHVQGLEKSYKTLEVQRGVDFDVAPGSIFALLSSNGAGKTTVVKILATLLRADAGMPPSTASTSPGRPRTCGSPSASPDSSRPSAKSSAGGRTSCWSPGCGTSRTPARSRMICSIVSR